MPGRARPLFGDGVAMMPGSARPLSVERFADPGNARPLSVLGGCVVMPGSARPLSSDFAAGRTDVPDVPQAAKSSAAVVTDARETRDFTPVPQSNGECLPLTTTDMQATT